jgi:prepilin-type N-terminal cleavage/methylation domain-containing protein
MSSANAPLSRYARSGYTVLELILVLALLTIVGALAYPSLESMYGNYKVTAGVDQVRAAWATARAHAAEEGRPYRFGIVSDQGSYRIAPDSGDFWGGNSSNAGGQSQDNADSPAFVLEETLPSGVRFSLADPGTTAGPATDSASAPSGATDSGQWSTVAVFMPDGTARQNVRIVFQASGGRPMVLRLRGLTGLVTARALQDAAADNP